MGDLGARRNAVSAVAMEWVATVKTRSISRRTRTQLMLIGSRRVTRELGSSGQVLERAALVKLLGIIRAFVSALPDSQTRDRQGTEVQSGPLPAAKITRPCFRTCTGVRTNPLQAELVWESLQDGSHCIVEDSLEIPAMA